MNDTIAAISTPLGEGGLAVVRLSGPHALAVADRCFRPSGAASVKPTAAASHTIHYGHVVREGRVVDEVLLAVMRAPRTFTREDVAEISCHGGVLLAKLVLDTVLASGARPAEPGEFTRRAFLNGRIDLAQAEAVADLIRSRTELAAAAAREQLAGTLSRRIHRLRDDLLRALAHVEAHIDFPDEDIAPDTQAQLAGRLERAAVFMDDLLRTAGEGQVLRQGVRAAIAGQPNVGKSSLLNQLLGHERAIVSIIPGTTRDTIEETANIRGLPVRLVDTAGLRDAGDVLEVEGMRRSREILARADLILHVLDASAPLGPADARWLREFDARRRIVVRNKIDLGCRLQLPAGIASPVADVSCLTGTGIDALKSAIQETIWSGAITAEMLQVAINARHEDALRRARDAVARTQAALGAGHTPELVALDLRLAVQAAGEVVGQTTTDDLLDAIFSQFCIGK
ncbi:MAG: tRNA uridine-5-carboxymethylaminomethyl(34) synthesis GTPase MnmE [Verrucomicrobia bacterium]|nr:tRNA uridine-5-carboxymethylaminomethyl(34) synthesis GTPase MnmE [Verrucomicrobiota bacterium]